MFQYSFCIVKSRGVLPRKVLEMNSDTWFPDRLVSDSWVSSRFSILLNWGHKHTHTQASVSLIKQNVHLKQKWFSVKWLMFLLDLEGYTLPPPKKQKNPHTHDSLVLISRKFCLSEFFVCHNKCVKISPCLRNSHNHQLWRGNTFTDKSTQWLYH